MPTLATALLQGLKDYGAREIFGIPGDFVLPLFQVIEDSGILPYYTLSHEPGVGFAARPACPQDYEYVRCGTAKIFCIVEPLTGSLLTLATANRKRSPWCVPCE